MPTQNEIRERITNTIVEALKSGQLPPWRRPWQRTPQPVSRATWSARRLQGHQPAALNHFGNAAWPHVEMVGHFQPVA